MVDGQTLEVGIVVAATDDLATDQPEVVPVAIEGGFGCLAPQQVEQEGRERGDDGGARREVRRFALPSPWPVVQIRAGLAQQGKRVGWDNPLLVDALP